MWSAARLDILDIAVDGLRTPPPAVKNLPRDPAEIDLLQIELLDLAVGHRVEIEHTVREVRGSRDLRGARDVRELLSDGRQGPQGSGSQGLGSGLAFRSAPGVHRTHRLIHPNGFPA